jgi:hypothetical protein
MSGQDIDWGKANVRRMKADKTSKKGEQYEVDEGLEMSFDYWSSDPVVHKCQSGAEKKGPIY